MLFFAGPAHVGQSITYRVTTTVSAQATPSASTLLLNWAAPTRLYARLLSNGTATAVMVTRGDDGTLSLATAPNDPTAALVATLLGQLNFAGRLAASLDGSDHGQMSLSVPAPATTASPAPQKSSPPIDVPVDINVVTNAGSATLIADGNSNQHSSENSGGYRRGRGGMGGMGSGGWRSHQSDRGRDSSGKRASVEIAVEALFDPSGILQHETYRETITPAAKGAQTTESTITIDRM
ncbi:MAG TPA: hypothetical protein VMF11_13600 [Candidatus Baltobacteraceae bacterium]|nr:hypothetical protein [Candidatus Baltobacteraceae bacterium]